jgi:hypothetical protein
MIDQPAEVHRTMRRLAPGDCIGYDQLDRLNGNQGFRGLVVAGPNVATCGSSAMRFCRIVVAPQLFD